MAKKKASFGHMGIKERKESSVVNHTFDMCKDELPQVKTQDTEIPPEKNEPRNDVVLEEKQNPPTEASQSFSAPNTNNGSSKTSDETQTQPDLPSREDNAPGEQAKISPKEDKKPPHETKDLSKTSVASVKKSNQDKTEKAKRIKEKNGSDCAPRKYSLPISLRGSLRRMTIETKRSQVEIATEALYTFLTKASHNTDNYTGESRSIETSEELEYTCFVFSPPLLKLLDMFSTNTGWSKRKIIITALEEYIPAKYTKSTKYKEDEFSEVLKLLEKNGSQ